mmetsp:Transcript_535/g.1615  ORF Transcript_535/g.1615 Transcript_535/m.1615 type:complete len:186 (-) Transcript_535:84-641(-)
MANRYHANWNSAGRMSSGLDAPKENFCSDMGILHVREYTYRIARLWAFTMKALPSEAARESTLPSGRRSKSGAGLLDIPVDGTQDRSSLAVPDTPASRSPSSGTADAQAQFMSIASKYLMNSMPGAQDPKLAKRKALAELTALEHVAVKHQVDLVKAKIDTIISILSSASISADFKQQLESQLQQ